MLSTQDMPKSAVDTIIEEVKDKTFKQKAFSDPVTAVIIRAVGDNVNFPDSIITDLDDAIEQLTIAKETAIAHLKNAKVAVK